MRVSNTPDAEVVLYRATAKQSKTVREVSEEQKDNPYARSLMEDGFGLFYRKEYTLLPEGSVPTAFLPNYQLLRLLSSLKEFRELKTYTSGDVLNSTAALFVLRKLQDQQEEGGGSPPPPSEGNESSEGQQPQPAEGQPEEGDGEEREEMQAALEEIEEELRAKARELLGKLSEEMDDAEKAERALSWGNEASKLDRIDIEKKIQLAETIRQHPQLQQILKLAGRLLPIAEQKQRERYEYERTEIESVGVGSELNRLLPTELVKLVVPELELLFLKDQAEHGLQQYELSSKPPLGKGPIVMAIDCSGSMSTRLGEYTRDIWSKAVALALARVAQLQRRHFIAFLFNTRRPHTITSDSTWEDIVQFLTYGVGGGTSFDEALEGCELALRTQEQADVVFISDGQCVASEDSIRGVKEKATVYGVQISSGAGGLEAFCDEIYPVRTLEDSVTTAESLFSIGGKEGKEKDAAK